MNIGILAIVAGLALAGLAPAVLAQAKGRSFLLWWLYGTVLFIAALPHSLLLRPRDPYSPVAGRVSCPSCGETLPAMAVSCRYCGCDLQARSATAQGVGPQGVASEPFLSRENRRAPPSEEAVAGLPSLEEARAARAARAEGTYAWSSGLENIRVAGAEDAVGPAPTLAEARAARASRAENGPAGAPTLAEARAARTEDGGETATRPQGEGHPAEARIGRAQEARAARPRETRSTGAEEPPRPSGGSRLGDDDSEPLHWSDDDFARISRMGPSGPERDPPDRRLIFIAIAAVALFFVGALSVTLLTSLPWFEDEPAPDRFAASDRSMAEGVQPPPAPDRFATPDRFGAEGVQPSPAPTEETAPPVAPPELPGAQLAPAPPQQHTPAPPPPVAPRAEALPSTPPLPTEKPVPPVAPGQAEAGDLALQQPGRSAREPEPQEPPAAPPQVSRATPPAAEPTPEAEVKERETPARTTRTPATRTPANLDAVGEESDVRAVGEMVFWLQRRLAAFGFYDGPIHGRADARTREAIREWQRGLKMTPSGRIDHALIVSLRRALPARPASGAQPTTP